MKARIANTSVLIVLTMGLSTLKASQSRPDFSGVWTPEDNQSATIPPPPPPSGAPGGPPPPPPPPRTLSLSITQSPTDLTVNRRVEVGGREETYAFVYRLDGSESVNRMGVLVFRTKAAWDGGSLVLSSAVSTEGNAFATSRDVYHLENGSLVVENTRNAPAGTFTSRTVHKRAQ